MNQLQQNPEAQCHIGKKKNVNRLTNAAGKVKLYCGGVTVNIKSRPTKRQKRCRVRSDSGEKKTDVQSVSVATCRRN